MRNNNRSFQGGGGNLDSMFSVLPDNQIISASYTPSDTDGTWDLVISSGHAIEADDPQLGGGDNNAKSDYRSGPGTQNSAIEWSFSCKGGTYHVALYHHTGTNRGIYTVTIDGNVIGTCDGYLSSINYDARKLFTGVSLEAGEHLIRLTMADKNASSGNYFGLVSKIVFSRTGD